MDVVIFKTVLFSFFAVSKKLLSKGQHFFFGYLRDNLSCLIMQSAFLFPCTYFWSFAASSNDREGRGLKSSKFVCFVKI